MHPHRLGAGGLDRYAYVNNSPMNYVDPSGHEPKYGDGACYEIDCKNANGTIPRLGNGEGGVLPRINCQNRSCVDPEYAEELSEFFNPVTLVEQMFSVDLTMSGTPSIGDGIEIACSGFAIRAGRNAASCDGIGEAVDIGIDVVEKTLLTVWNSPGSSADTNFRTPSSTPTLRTPTPIPTSTITPTINTPTRTSMPTSTLSQTPSATLSQPNTYPPSTTPTLYFSTPTYPVNSSTPTYWLTP